MTTTLSDAPPAREPFRVSLRRKVAVVRREPMDAAAKRLHRFFHGSPIGWIWGIAINRWAEGQLRRRGCLEFLEHWPAHALRPVYIDLWLLYRAVRRRQPQVILEFGSGCSTVVLAQALWNNSRLSPGPGGRLYAVETDPVWAKVTHRALPERLRAVCEVWDSPLAEVEWDGTPSFRHARLPEVAPDFIYLDGPALTPERQVAVDILDLESQFPRGLHVVVDGRWQNATFLRRHLRRRYRFRNEWWFKRRTFTLIG